MREAVVARGAAVAPPPGLHEAVARGVAQSLIYCIETVKTHQQIFGKLPTMSAQKWLDHIGRGMLSSVLSSGFVFGAYYSVYNRFSAPSPFAPIAGPISTLATSVIKIPMGNSMRLLQAGIGRNIMDSGRRLIRQKGILGLYGGFGLSVAEDAIEWDTRERLYQLLKNHPSFVSLQMSPTSAGVLLGALTGMFASGITTPFDTLRSRIAYQNIGGKPVVAAAVTAASAASVASLFTGAQYRMLSCGIKSGLFYAILETIRAPPPLSLSLPFSAAPCLARCLPPSSL